MLDRLQVFACAISGSTPPVLQGYRVVRDCFIRAQTPLKAYERMREYVHLRTGTRIFLQYKAHRRSLPQFKLTVVSDDIRPISRTEIRRLLKSFRIYRMSLLEISFDFESNSGMDLQFVRWHAIFGKSHPKISRLYRLSDGYGSRKGDKYIRSYWKEEIKAFRLEVEFHSRWLKRNAIETLEDLRKLPSSMFPKEIQFVRLDWEALSKYLARRGIDPTEIISRAKAESNSIHSLLDFLRTSICVANAHRFLRPLRCNQDLKASVESWLREW